MNSNIYILSQPIHSGKTTALQQWLSTQNNAAGILMPDINGRRKLYDIANQKQYDLQVEEASNAHKIGKYLFDKAVFKIGNDILIQAINNHYDWIIIDEIGRLEMDEQLGFTPALERILSFFKQHNTSTKLLLVIRDYLLDKAINHYALQNATILSASLLEAHNIINGLVLCGGNSARMKKDKAFIQYHSQPQYLFTANILQQFCKQVCISSTAVQIDKMQDSYEKINDDDSFVNNGPISGIATMITHQPKSSLLVVACDYPYLKRQDILQLILNRNENYDVVCYQNEAGFYEPLIAIYEASCYAQLIAFIQTGNSSLQQFLKTVRTKSIAPNRAIAIQSIDTPEKAQQFKLKKYYNE